MKATILITMFLLSAICSQGQTPSQYDRLLLAKIVVLENNDAIKTKQIDTLYGAMARLLYLTNVMQKEIDSLKSVSHKLTFESPLVADSIKNYIKIDLAELKARLQ